MSQHELQGGFGLPGFFGESMSGMSRSRHDGAQTFNWVLSMTATLHRLNRDFSLAIGRSNNQWIVGRVLTRHVGLKPDLRANRKFGVYNLTFTRRAKKEHGFTLIEIMVVVVILGILAALVAPKLMGRTDEARIVAARQDIATIVQALKLYRLDNLRYPTTEQGLQALLAKPSSGPQAGGWKAGGYLDKLPKDPWGNTYLYLAPGIRGEIDVFSFGADGQAGGEGNDADIGSWEL